jgi:hypothetical protein
MQIVDNLNTMLKENFRDIVQSQIEVVFQEVAKKVDHALEMVRGDVTYNAQVMTPLDDIIREESIAFSHRVDGVVVTYATRLDELLLYQPKGFWGLTGGNEILDGLEEAARLGVENLRNADRPIQAQDFAAKTQQIRQTLTAHYINKVKGFHVQITHDLFPLVINIMQQIETRIMEVMQSRYRPALETVLADDIGGEFVARRRALEERSRRFRELIDQIEQTQKDMAHVLGLQA